MNQLQDGDIPLPGEWYWGIMCPSCHLHCPMHRDVQQGTIPTTEIAGRSAQPRQARVAGTCGHCHTPYDVPADQFHHFQIPDDYYN